MNGSSHPSKRLSGLEKKMRNYCILLKLCPHSGELLPQLLEVIHLSASKCMRSYLIQLLPRMRTTKLGMTQENCVPEGLSPFQNPSQRDLIQWIWMRMRRRCFLKHRQGRPTQEVRKQKGKPERSSLRRLKG